MKVEELFRRLSYGELSNLAIGNDGTGSIREEKYPAVIQYVNEGLLKLAGRFVLVEKNLLIEQVSHITNYHMKRIFAESSNSTQRWPYIKDLGGEPFEEDVIKILEVWEVDGQRLPLNDMGNPLSLFTPQPDVLQVPNPVEGKALSITYQARLPKLDDTLDGEKTIAQEINIPFALEGALQAYVAHKVYKHMNGQENTLKATEHEASFNAICLEVNDRDLLNGSISTTHNKLEERGFV